jgi:hypothetical protein
MTREEVLRRWDALSPRERDVWVAEAVFGKTVVPVRVLEGYRLREGAALEDLEPVFAEVPCVQEHGAVAYLTHMPDAEYVLDVVPYYTEDIEAAWDVVERLRERFGRVRVEAGACRLEAGGAPGGPYRVAVGDWVAEGATAAEAIAKAALLAVCAGGRAEVAGGG